MLSREPKAGKSFAGGERLWDDFFAAKQSSDCHASNVGNLLRMSTNDSAPFVECRLLVPGDDKTPRRTFKIFYAIHISPPRTVGEPGDLWITLSPLSAYYKAAQGEGQERDKWRLGTFEDSDQRDISHPQFPKLVLSLSSLGPTWRSRKSSLNFLSMEESIMMFFDQRGILNALPGGSNNPIEI